MNGALKNFLGVSWRDTTAAHPETGAVGLSFNADGGAVIRLLLDGASADQCAASITESRFARLARPGGLRAP